MSATSSANETSTKVREALSAFDLNRQHLQLLEGSSTITLSTTLPLALLEQLPLTPDIGDETVHGISLVDCARGIDEKLVHAFVASDLEVISGWQEDSHDSCLVQRPLGLKEWVYPLHVRDRLVGMLWGGKFKETSPTDADLEGYAKNLGVSETSIRRFLDEIPNTDATDIERQHRYMGLLQQTAIWALSAEHRSLDLNTQLLEQEHTQALGAVSSGVAHHFNNLLSVILGYSSFLLNRTDTSEEASEALRVISEAAQKGRRLTEEILAFAGSEVEKETVCSVHEYLEHACSLLASQESGRIRFKREFAASSDHVRAPRSALHQTIYNLLSNSIDSLPEGGELTIRTANEPVADSEPTAPSIRIEVIDSNVTPEIMALSESETPQKGSANKWARLHRMVNRLEGSTAVSPAHAVWNRAEITLPLEDTPLPSAQEGKPQKRLAPSIIWIVDDDPIFCEMCKRVLEDDGHQVVTMESGTALHEAWEASAPHPNLLIIDFSMPEYNGLELCEWLKERGSRAPVILVSGFSHNQPDIHKALKLRKTFFLQKPFPVPELADVVSVALGETLLGQ